MRRDRPAGAFDDAKVRTAFPVDRRRHGDDVEGAVGDAGRIGRQREAGGLQVVAVDLAGAVLAGAQFLDPLAGNVIADRAGEFAGHGHSDRQADIAQSYQADPFLGQAVVQRSGPSRGTLCSRNSVKLSRMTHGGGADPTGIGLCRGMVKSW